MDGRDKLFFFKIIIHICFILRLGREKMNFLFQLSGYKTKEVLYSMLFLTELFLLRNGSFLMDYKGKK